MKWKRKGVDWEGRKERRATCELAFAFAYSSRNFAGYRQSFPAKYSHGQGIGLLVFVTLKNTLREDNKKKIV